MGVLDQTEAEAFSVSDLTGHIKMLLEGTFPNVWVAGEVSDVSRPRSGHIYFTLKDSQAQIRGILWRGTAERLRKQAGGLELNDGDAVICQGDIDVYAQRGQYQLIVRRVQSQGIGSLQQRFEQLQAKLNAEGLFDAEHKQPLPKMPRRVGVVTSPSGAAIRDFLKAASERFQGTDIVILPASVQGAGAADSLAQAIEAAERFWPELDALVVTRGGGSLEDLWCFNEEPVVRAISACPIPVISGVGHEIDVTLCDLVADVRALTPTDAANRLLPDGDQMKQMLGEWGRRMDRSVRTSIADAKRGLESLESRRCFQRPHEVVREQFRQLDDWERRSERAIRHRIAAAESEWRRCASTLDALSPLRVLSRGYSVTSDSTGRTVTDLEGLSQGDVIHTRIDQGQIESVVTKTSHGEEAEPTR